MEKIALSFPLKFHGISKFGSVGWEDFEVAILKGYYSSDMVSLVLSMVEWTINILEQQNNRQELMSCW